jgi:hypothetical protein
MHRAVPCALATLVAACGGRDNSATNAGSETPPDAGVANMSDSAPSEDGDAIACIVPGAYCTGGCIAMGGQCVAGDGICTGVVATQFSCGESAALGLYCCLPEPVDCGQPHAMTIVCLEAGTPTCMAPELPIGAPGFDPSAPEGDAAYAPGCKVTYPFCSSGMLYECTCTPTGELVGPTGATAGAWNCNGL